jgi:hypothetical protein
MQIGLSKVYLPTGYLVSKTLTAVPMFLVWLPFAVFFLYSVSL